MKKNLLLVSLGFLSFNAAFGQSQDHSNASSDKGNRMTMDKINPDEEVAISIVKAPDGSDRIMFKDGNIFKDVKDISLMVVDGEIAQMGSNYPRDVVSAKLLSKSTATALYGPRGANGALAIYTKAYKAPPGPVSEDK